MTDLRLVDAARFTDQNAPKEHQVKAWAGLQKQLTTKQVEDFFKAYRNAPPPTPEASKNAAVKALLQFIYAGEGGYTSVNRGRAGDTPGGLGGLVVTTIGDVKRAQAAGQFSAVGAPQFIPSTLPMAQAAAKLPDSALFSPENQDRMATALLLGGKRPALAAYLLGRSTDLDAAQTDMAKEWASVPLPNGKGFHDGDSAGNKATAKVAAVRAALVAAREGIIGAAAPTPPAPKIAVPAQQPAKPKPKSTAKSGSTVKPKGELATISGMIGPKKRPHDFGFKEGDTHLIMNDKAETLTAWSYSGQRLWIIGAMARGQGRDDEWQNPGTDCPPGLYRLGQLYDDVSKVGLKPKYTKTLAAYGYMFYDMVELENQEAGIGRAGIGLHGGGSSLGWPAAWAPNQKLVPTLGCIRASNSDLRDKIMPLYKQGTVFVSVFQEIS